MSARSELQGLVGGLILGLPCAAFALWLGKPFGMIFLGVLMVSGLTFLVWRAIREGRE